MCDRIRQEAVSTKNRIRQNDRKEGVMIGREQWGVDGYCST